MALADGVEVPTTEQVDDHFHENSAKLKPIKDKLVDYVTELKDVPQPYTKFKKWFKENAPGMQSLAVSGKDALCAYVVAYADLNSGKWTPDVFNGSVNVVKVLQQFVPDDPGHNAKACMHCSAILQPADASFCGQCGKVPDGKAQDEQKCKKCAANVVQNAPFCHACGETMGVHDVQQPTCDACHKPMSSSQFCPSTGVKHMPEGEKSNGQKMEQAIQSAINMIQQANEGGAMTTQLQANLKQIQSTLQQAQTGMDNERAASEYSKCRTCQCTLIRGQPQCYNCGTTVMPQGAAPTARLPSQWTGGDPMPPCQQGKENGADTALPKFMYNQQTKHIVDPEAPMDIPACPSAYTPNPLLQSWKPASGVYMHPAETGRLSSFQEIMAYLYAAIGQGESCEWPNPIEGIETKWSRLSNFGKAMALVEAAIARMALTREEGLTSQEANLELGIGSQAFTTAQRAAIGKRVGIHRKADKMLHTTQTTAPTQAPRKVDTRYTQPSEKTGAGKEMVCWTCGKKGHVAAKCRSSNKPPKDTAAQEAAVKARLHQLTQAAEHAAKRDKSGGDL